MVTVGKAAAVVQLSLHSELSRRTLLEVHGVGVIQGKNVDSSTVIAVDKFDSTGQRCSVACIVSTGWRSALRGPNCTVTSSIAVAIRNYPPSF
jgi:hypothetical protein